MTRRTILQSPTSSSSSSSSSLPSSPARFSLSVSLSVSVLRASLVCPRSPLPPSTDRCCRCLAAWPRKSSEITSSLLRPPAARESERGQSTSDEAQSTEINRGSRRRVESRPCSGWTNGLTDGGAARGARARHGWIYRARQKV